MEGMAGCQVKSQRGSWREEPPTPGVYEGRPGNHKPFLGLTCPLPPPDKISSRSSFSEQFPRGQSTGL